MTIVKPGGVLTFLRYLYCQRLNRSMSSCYKCAPFYFYSKESGILINLEYKCHHWFNLSRKVIGTSFCGVFFSVEASCALSSQNCQHNIYEWSYLLHFSQSSKYYADKQIEEILNLMIHTKKYVIYIQYS